MRPERETGVEGILLGRELSGERHWKLTLLSPEHGVVVCLWRASRKPEADKPDLFDRAEIDWAAADGGVSFASNYRVLQRQSFLMGNYQRLALACRMALLLTRNPPPVGSAAPVLHLCETVLAALGERPFPEAAYCKFLWQWMRMEGYPVREQWLEELAEEMRSRAAKVLSQSLDQQTAGTEEIAGLARSLERWMREECQFVLPD